MKSNILSLIMLAILILIMFVSCADKKSSYSISSGMISGESYGT